MKKKILIIGMSDIIGGVETYIYNLIRLINKDKYHFDFLVIGQGIHSVFENEINALLNDGKNHFFYCPNLKKHYIKAHRWLKDFYRQNKYDIIYLNTCTSARISYCRYALKKSRTKLITHSHNGRADNYIGEINNKIFKRYTTNKSSKLLACSDVAYKYMFSNKPSGKWFIPNGVRTDRFKYNQIERETLRRKLNIPEEKIVIGCVGRFSAQKNYGYLVDLSELLPEKYCFLCIGDGDEKEAIKSRIIAEYKQDYFIILDSQKDIERYYNAMDIFVMPSIFEGLPITAIEAQCNGLPCVFSDTITKQVGLTDNCSFISLQNKKEWATTITQQDIKRCDGESIIAEKGFDELAPVLLLEELFDLL